MTALDALEKTLLRLIRERRRVFIADGLVKFSIALAASVAIVSIFAHVSTNAIYFSALKILASAAMTLAFLKFLLPPILKRETPADVASEVRKFQPDFGEDALNALNLKSDLPRLDALNFSRPLVEAHLEGVSERLARLDLSPAVPKAGLKRRAKQFLPVLIAATVATLAAPPQFRSFLLGANFLPPRSPEILELADIELEYNFPAYTKLPPRSLKAASGDVKAIKGARVVFRATPVLRLQGARLVAGENAPIPVRINDGRVYVEFVVTASGSFHIEANDGRLRSRQFGISAVADAPPKASILSPGSEIIELNRDDALNIEYAAEDDFGLSKLALEWEDEGGRQTKPIVRSPDDARNLDGIYVWNLAQIQPPPDGIVEARVIAHDNDAVSGVKLGSSAPIRIKIGGADSAHRDAVAGIEESLSRFLSALAGNIERRPQPPRGNFEAIKAVQLAQAEEIQQASDALSIALRAMEGDTRSAYPYFVALSNIAAKMEGLKAERTRILDAPAPDFAGLLRFLETEVEELEEASLFLDSMIQGGRIRDAADAAGNAARKFGELSRLIADLKGGATDEARGEIERKLNELRELLARLTENLGSIDAGLQDGFLNRDAFDAEDLNADFEEIMKLVREGKLDEALAGLAGLGSRIESLRAALDSGAGALGSSSLAKDMENLGKLMSKIGDVAKSQEALKGTTENLKGSMLKSGGGDDVKKFVSEQMRKIERARGELREASAEALAEKSIQNSFLIDRLLDDLSRLERWLQAREFDEALKRAKEAEDGARLLKNLENSNSERFNKSARIAEEIRRDLEKAQNSEIKSGGMSRIAGRQDAIERDASKLSKDAESGGIPIPEIQERLDEAMQFMQGSSRNLRGGEISKSIANQGDAVKSLREAEAEAGELMRQFQMSARGQRATSVPMALGRRESGAGGGIDTGYVEIPAEGESKSAKIFKEAVLKSLKEGSPEGYDDLNRKYYERIVK